MTSQELVEAWWSEHIRSSDIHALLRRIERDLLREELSPDAGAAALRLFTEIRLRGNVRREFQRLLSCRIKSPISPDGRPPDLEALIQRRAELESRVRSAEQEQAAHVTGRRLEELEIQRRQLASEVEKLKCRDAAPGGEQWTSTRPS